MGRRWTLHLLCEAPSEWHQTRHEGYSIHESAEWLKTMAPYLRRILKGLKAVAPLIIPGVGMWSAELAKEWKHHLKFSQEALDKLTEYIGAESESGLLEHNEVAKASGIALQQLHAFLKIQAPNGPWGDLAKTLTPEGDYLWLCEEHAKELGR